MTGNRLSERGDAAVFHSAAAAFGKQIPGSDGAGQQLQGHCDQLNERERRMRSGKEWFVSGQAPTRHVSVRTVG